MRGDWERVRVVTEQMREGCCCSDPESRTGAAVSRNSAGSAQLLPALRGAGILELLLLTTCVWVDPVLMMLSICTSFFSPITDFFCCVRPLSGLTEKTVTISYILILLHSDFCTALGVSLMFVAWAGWSPTEPAQRCWQLPART